MKKIFISFILFLLAMGIQASETNKAATYFTPIQLSIWNPVQLAPESWDVFGVRLDLVRGKNRGVFGIDLGLVNSAEQLSGVQIGFFNDISGCTATPTAIFPIISYATSRGIQIGTMNMVFGNFDGVQIGGAVNSVYKRVRGIQISGFGNDAGDMRGLQIGIVNRAKTMIGIQIGVINTIKESPVPFFPIINAHF